MEFGFQIYEVYRLPALSTISYHAYQTKR